MRAWSLSSPKTEVGQVIKMTSGKIRAKISWHLKQIMEKNMAEIRMFIEHRTRKYSEILKIVLVIYNQNNETIPSGHTSFFGLGWSMKSS